MMESYRRGLEPDELLRVVARLLRAQRRADGLICSYLADLSDALKRRPALVLVYGDVHQLARYKLGLSLRASRDRVRVGKALRQLERLRSALMAGDLAYSRVREVTRVARPDNECHWLRAARELSMRQLEKRVAACSGRAGRVPSGVPGTPGTPGTPGASGPPEPQGRASSSGQTGSTAPGSPSTASSSTAGALTSGSPSTFRPSAPTDGRSLYLSQRVWVLLEEAMREARAQSSQPLTDIEAVECVVRAALVQQSRTRLSLASQLSQHAGPASIARTAAARNRNVEESLEHATQGGSLKQSASGGKEATQGGLWCTDTEREESRAPTATDGSEALLEATSVSGGFPGKEDSVGPVSKESTSKPGQPAEPAPHQRGTESTSIGKGAGARRDPLSSDARQLLELIRGGKLWNVATLGCETGMSLPRLAVALTDLEFSRRVRRDVVGFYEFVGEPDDEPPFREAS